MYKTFDEAFPHLMNRIETLPQYELRMEISRSTDLGVLELLRLFATSTTQGSSLGQPKKFDYGNVLFIHLTVDADGLKGMFNLINRGMDISLIEFPELKQIGTQQLKAQCSQIEYNHISSCQLYSYRQLSFPYHLYQIASKTEMANELHMPLGGTGLLFFRTKIQAQAYYLRAYNAPNSTQRVDSCVEVVIQDTRGRFVEVAVHNSKIEFVLDGDALGTCEVKLNGTNPALVESVTAFDAQRLGVAIEALPRELNVILMEGAEIIDERFISKQSSPFNLTHGVSFMDNQAEMNFDPLLHMPDETEHSVYTTENGLDEFHPIVQRIASNLYNHGYYRQAILDTYIALVQQVQKKSGKADLDGTKLMQAVFSPKNPLIKLSADSDEQMGFMWLFSGAVMAVRNPKAHKLDDTLDRQQAKEWLGFASVLFRLLDGRAESPMV